MSETAERAPEEVAALPPTPGLGGGPWGAVKRAGAVLAQQREATVFVVAVLLVIYFWRASPAFLTKDNIVNVSQITAPVAIIAIGEVFLLVCGEIDLSVGFIFAFSPFLMGILIGKTENFEAGFLVIVASAILGSCALIPLAMTATAQRGVLAVNAAPSGESAQA